MPDRRASSVWRAMAAGLLGDTMRRSMPPTRLATGASSIDDASIIAPA